MLRRRGGDGTVPIDWRVSLLTPTSSTSSCGRSKHAFNLSACTTKGLGLPTLPQDEVARGYFLDNFERARIVAAPFRIATPSPARIIIPYPIARVKFGRANFSVVIFLSTFRRGREVFANKTIHFTSPLFNVFDIRARVFAVRRRCGARGIGED
jgi:hypothetical protein